MDQSSGKQTHITRNVDPTSLQLSPNFYLSPNDFNFNAGENNEFPPSVRFITPEDIYGAEDEGKNPANVLWISFGLLLLCFVIFI